MWKVPRAAMRPVLRILQVAKVGAADVAFKPFGGGAGALRRDRNVRQQEAAGTASKGLEGDDGGHQVSEQENAQNRAHSDAGIFPLEFGKVKVSGHNSP